jgi:uncharacterized protein DUF6458
MSIPAGIFLLALGAILAWGVADRWDAVDLTAVGYILMAAGALGIALAMLVTKRRNRAALIDPEVEQQYRGDQPPEIEQTDQLGEPPGVAEHERNKRVIRRRRII